MCESHNIIFKVFNEFDPDVALPTTDTMTIEHLSKQCCWLKALYRFQGRVNRYLEEGRGIYLMDSKHTSPPGSGNPWKLVIVRDNSNAKI